MYVCMYVCMCGHVCVCVGKRCHNGTCVMCDDGTRMQGFIEKIPHREGQKLS